MGAPGNLFNLFWTEIEELKDITVHVDIEKPSLLPRVYKMADEKRLKKTETAKQSKPEVAQKNQPEENMLDNYESVREIIKAADTSDDAMLRYQDIVRQRIEERRKYPPRAKKQEIEGIVYLRFAILSDGQTDKIKIAKSSGYKILDQSAVSTVKKANPFPALPEEIKARYIQMEVILAYTLSDSK